MSNIQEWRIFIKFCFKTFSEASEILQKVFDMNPEAKLKLMSGTNEYRQQKFDQRFSTLWMKIYVKTRTTCRKIV